MESSKPHFRTKVSTSKSTAKDVITKSAKVITTNDIIRDIAAKSAKIATINNAIRDIVVQSATRALTTNDDLSNLAMEILQRNGKWTDLDSHILKSLKYTYERAKCEIEAVDGPLYNRVLSWVKNGSSTEEIIIKLNHLGVHS